MSKRNRDHPRASLTIGALLRRLRALAIAGMTAYWSPCVAHRRCPETA